MMTGRKHSLLKGLFLSLLLLSGKLFAQQPGFELSAQGGFIWAHTKSMRHLVTDYLYGSEIGVFKRPSDTATWASYYGSPAYGVTLNWTNFNNQKLGEAYALSGYFDVPLVRTGNTEFFFRPSTGLAYLNTHYDPDENFSNIAIGSSVNAAIRFSLLSRFRLSGKLSGIAGLSVGHFSNGANRYPNLGINLPVLQAGLAWDPYGFQEIEKSEKPVFTPGWHAELKGAFGTKGLEAGNRSVYPVYGLGGHAVRRVSYKSSFSAGVDAFYSSLLGKGLRVDSDASNPGPEAIRSGVFLGYRMHLNRFSYNIGMGAYLYAPYKGDGFLYHRFGVAWELKRLILSAGIKSHFAVADNFEIGAGWKIF